jgi:uncharacterized protein with HEPN domain
MNRDIKLYIQDIWESILAIEEYTRNLTEDEFYSKRQAQDAVVRRMEIIGEAAKNVDDEFRGKYPEIPWRKVAGTRDIVAHEYFGVRLDRIWDIVKDDLPDLKRKIHLIMEREKINGA